MTEELQAKDFELEHQQTVIERLRSQKRALKAKVETLTTNVEEYKTAMENAGLTFVEEEVDARARSPWPPVLQSCPESSCSYLGLASLDS